MGFFSTIETFTLDLLFPISCAGCGREDAHLCSGCVLTMPIWAPACFVCKKIVPADDAIPAGRTCRPCREKSRIYASFSPYSYDHPAIRALIHDLKYRRMRGAAPALGDILITALSFYGVSLPRDAFLVPIPLYPARARVRGFNQAHLLADHIGKELGISVCADLLKKIKNTRPQMQLSRDERLKNVSNAFAVSDSAAVANRTIILLDDVKTTGATLESAARALKRAGARKIWALTVAR